MTQLVHAPIKTATAQRERMALYRKYSAIVSANPELNRQLVSFQGNRNLPIYGWFKYKEGFSVDIVSYLLKSLSSRRGRLLDPFAGAGTALFAAHSHGWDTVGIELLPVGRAIFDVRKAADKVDLKKLRRAIDLAKRQNWPDLCRQENRYPHITITRCAFPEKTECAIAGYKTFCAKQGNHLVRRILEFAGLCVLESVSFTRKDGQYLRWDARSGKSRESGFNKGVVREFGDALGAKLEAIYGDIQTQRTPGFNGRHYDSTMDYCTGSCLEKLPELEPESVDLVLTSPPYCNRYDYTRTYALELVHLGAGAEIKDLRQAMLSCTVENHEKRDQLERFYASRNRLDDFVAIDARFHKQKALSEVLKILESARDSGKLNNQNIPKMVRNYFYEMAFVIFELSRVLAKGGKVVMVNDNVRYAGEEVPVDLILTDFAESFGLKPVHIWTLARGKGNSSQQMGSHGRTELRKCVYVWQKPDR